MEEKSISLRKLIEYFNLEVLVDGNLDRRIEKNDIHRVGYELKGFFYEGEDDLKKSLHIMGLKEKNYLSRLSEEELEKILNEYFSHDFPALVLSSRVKHIDILLEIAKKKNKVVLRCKTRATEFIREISIYLKDVLGKEMILNNCILLDVYGIGILLRGARDLKLGASIELLERGHKFITDSKILLRQTSSGIVGINRRAMLVPDGDFHLLMEEEADDINVSNIFGLKATRVEKKINLLVDLEIWQEKKFYDRLGVDEVYEELPVGKIRKITLPAKKGRNLAVVIETAAKDFRLRVMGKNSAEFFLEESKKLIMENKRKRECEEMENESRLSLKTFIKDNDIEVLIGEEYSHKKFITTTSIHKPTMAFSGVFDLDDEEYENKGLQLFTKLEIEYLKTLNEKQRDENLNKYFSYEFPAIVICGDLKLPDYIIKMIEDNKKMLLKVSENNPSYVVASLNDYLEEYFSPSMTMHGVFLEMNGFGVLLTGKSGVGKSETALELIHRGHRLVADDMVKFKRRPSGEIVGSAAKLPYFMEIRGLGIIDIKTLYGMGAVRIKKNIDAVIELKELENENYLTSVNYASGTQNILGKDIYKAELYMSSGRNAAAMVEVVVMSLIAKKMGHSPITSYKKLEKEIEDSDKE